MARDRTTVTELVRRAEAPEQPAGFLAVLGQLDPIPVEQRRELLAAALVRRPDDLTLLMTLGKSYPFEQRDGAQHRARWFQAAAGVRPGNVAARINLGVALADGGELDGAVGEFSEAVRLDPTSAVARNDLGVALLDKKNPDGAIAEFKEAVRLDPNYATPHLNLGNALKVKGDLDGAIAEYKEAVRLDPRNARSRTNLGNVLSDSKDLDGAIAEWKEALALEPRYVFLHNNVGYALQAKGDLSKACETYRSAIKADPKNVYAHNQLAWLLAAGPEGVRDGEQAVEHATRACELTAWKEPKYIDTLAAGYAEAGQFDKAMDSLQKALTFATFEKQSGESARQRLGLFAQKKPYRDPRLQPREIAPPPRLKP